ncbi:MAG: HAD-IC family P-type ATPase, partial [Myxococcales bacterium]|nr:HAD-IC family P-type ATPase [Myxococcales bacterium]
AAAAVLLGAPLLAARRSAQAPLVSAAAAAVERGMIFEDAATLELAGRSSVAVFCTRGTVTRGRPEIVEVTALGDEDPARLIGLAAAAETCDRTHPIANAICRHAESKGIRLPAVRRALQVPGRGLTALGPKGEELVIGNRRLLLDEGVSVALADTEAAHAELRGHSVVFVGIGGRVRGILALQDDVRAGARAAVQRVFDLHIEVVLISGDHRATAEAVAQALDISHLKADLLPEERAAEVRRLREGGHTVAAIGRAIHDDSTLGQADVPIVLGAAGAPAGERGIALTSLDVRDGTGALWIAHAARSAAWRGLSLVLASGATLMTLAAIGLIGPGIAAALTLALDAFTLPAGNRLLRRIQLRIPVRG